MRNKFTFISIAVLSSTVLCSPVRHVVRDMKSVPLGWTMTGATAPNLQIKLNFALKQTNIAGLLSKLEDLGNPDHPDFRKWMSQEQVNSYISAESSTTLSVTKWMASNGIPESVISQPAPNYLSALVTVSQAEALLQTRYNNYTHANLRAPIARTLSYSLPADIDALVEAVGPTTVFAQPVTYSDGTTEFVRSIRQHTDVKKRDVTCNPLGLTPACIQAEYNIDWTPSNHAGAQVGAAGIGSAPASRTDAQLYSEQIATGTIPFRDITLPNAIANTGDANGEGNLDTQLIAGLGNGNDAYYIEVGSASSDSFMDLASYLSGDASAIPAVSISYAANEDGIDEGYLDSVCNGYAAAAAKGITVFVASGDRGVSGNNDPSQPCSQFVPLFPSNCPYVVSVGGVDFVTADEFQPHSSNDPGMKAAWFGAGGTGGGFSNHFSMPDYQTSAVQGYINQLNGEYNGLYNASGRAYPDVSAHSDTWAIFVNGQQTQSGGTSASAPVWAAIASLINDYRISIGQPTLGYLNPSLYKNANLFTDITRNGTQGCGGPGFPALSGWDAATGLGVPIFSSLRTAL